MSFLSYRLSKFCLLGKPPRRGNNPFNKCFFFGLPIYWLTLFLYLIFLVTLVNKNMYVSGVLFYNTSSMYFILCLPPQAKSFSITTYLPFTLSYLSHFTPINIAIYEIFFCLKHSFFLPNPSSPILSDRCPSLFSVSVSLFLFCFLVFFVH